MKLSLAPIQFFWQKETLLEFYVQMLDSPLDTIYLGETVCSRRQKMRFDDWFGLAQDLADSGKEIILSSRCRRMISGMSCSWGESRSRLTPMACSSWWCGSRVWLP